MNTPTLGYEAPTLRDDGDLVRQTRNSLMKDTEADTTPQSVIGSVGFGV